jgi:hypothetical protein
MDRSNYIILLQFLSPWLLVHLFGPEDLQENEDVVMVETSKVMAALTVRDGRSLYSTLGAL